MAGHYVDYRTNFRHMKSRRAGGARGWMAGAAASKYEGLSPCMRLYKQGAS